LGCHGGGEESGKAYYLRVPFLDSVHYLLGIAVHAQIFYLNTLALDHHLNKVFPDVVKIALDGADKSFPNRIYPSFGKMRFKDFCSFVHCTGGNKNLRYKDLVAFEFSPDNIHTRHQGFFQNIPGSRP